VLASYTFAKFLDTNSTDYCGCTNSDNLSNIDVARDYGPSDFDQRHFFAAAISYEVPSPMGTGVAVALLRGWALYGVLHVSSALPSEIYTVPQSPAYGYYTTDRTSYPTFRSTSQVRSRAAAF
jgi:hypothetical protein